MKHYEEDKLLYTDYRDLLKRCAMFRRVTGRRYKIKKVKGGYRAYLEVSRVFDGKTYREIFHPYRKRADAKAVGERLVKAGGTTISGSFMATTWKKVTRYRVTKEAPGQYLLWVYPGRGGESHGGISNSR